MMGSVWAIHQLFSDVNLDLDNVPQTTPDDTSVTAVLTIFFGAMAGIAVLVITLASLNFALSRGNPEKANKARDTIIYAGVGLAVAVLASAIIRFVVGSV